MHFPVDSSGAYIGQPANSEEALVRLDLAQQLGVEYLLFPSFSRWWLDYYKGFTTYLYSYGRIVLDQPQICSLFRLRK